ncbi:AMP-binding protein [Achromobacter sp. Marseille-Q0513]|uniref:AMP-binding protein n=1 Tax=Achromobacter sp. Marseille-Q0513 TaxID=2829161 RepID=UPI001BA0C0AD|nr:AMP-binding protein [Achromobacter sp. Marseille-Q0513]MBR8655448.1 AMP-binding protein [Achromobacter sp. Marseille-Q0513]
MNGALPARIALIPELLERAAADWPDRTALVCGERRVDYRRYAAEVRAAARRLRQALPPGARVATLLGNSDLACVLTLALQMAGCQHVPLNPLYTARELDFILRDAEAALLIADEASSALAAPLAADQGIRLLDGATARAWTVPSDETPAAAPPGDADAPALLQYTGGTTGQPKGVILSRTAIATNVFQREAVLPTRHGAETVLCAMPLFHSYGMAMGLFLAASAAATLVVLPRYRPDDVFDAVARERVTLFPGSPTIYAGLMAHARFTQTDWSSVRVCYSGSAPLAEETLRRWEAAVGAPIYEGYGQTEAGPILTYNGPQGSRAGSVGRPVPGTEVEVVDLETGAKPLLPGQRGEIRARGPQIMQGYLARPEATAESLRDGWLYTGDIGEFAEDGFLYIRDRKKDLVIVGGYNVYPREVDEVLYLHADVAQAAAVGWPDSYRGEVIRAFVVLRPGASADEAALLAHCQANLARYKVPAVIEILDALPCTSANKVDKKALRARA